MPPGMNFDTELSIYPIFFSKVQITIKTPKTGEMFQLFYLNAANKLSITNIAQNQNEILVV